MPAHKILPYCHWCGAKIRQTINHKPYLCSKKLNRFNLAEELRTLLNADPPAYNTSTDNLVRLERTVTGVSPSVHTSGGVPLSKIHCNVDRLTPPQCSLTITTNQQLKGWAVTQLSHHLPS